MTLDVGTNGIILSAHVNYVLEGAFTWVVLGYEGTSYTLKVINRGNHEADLVDELAPGKILYGFVKLSPSKMGPFKFILVSWQSSCAPEGMKIACARHVDQVKRICRTVHLTIHVTDENDLNFDAIRNQLFGNVETNENQYETEVDKVEVVKSNYERVDPLADIPIGAVSRSFWNQQLQQNTSTPMKTNKLSNFTKPVIKQESQNTKQTQKVTNYMNGNMNNMNNTTATATGITINPSIIHTKSVSNNNNNHEQLGNTSNRIESNEEMIISPLHKRIEALNRSQQVSVNNERAVNCTKTLPKQESQNTNQLNKNTNHTNQNIAYSTTVNVNNTTVNCNNNNNNNSKNHEQLGNTSNGVDTNEEMIISPLHKRIEALNRSQQVSVNNETSNTYRKINPFEEIMLARKLSNASVSNTESNNVKPVNNSTTEQSTNVTTHYPPVSTTCSQQNVVNNTVPNELHSTSTSFDTPQTLVNAVTTDEGLKAVCMFAYSAREDDELSLEVGEYIVQIDQIDEGWWLGQNIHGEFGLFPANYVQLIS